MTNYLKHKKGKYSMLVENDDVEQEYILQLLEGKYRQKWQVKQDMIKSRAWSSVITPLIKDKVYEISYEYESNVLERIIEREFLKAEMKKLPKHLRIILGLYIIKEKTQKELSERLNLERSSISKRLKAIRRYIDES